MNTRFALFGEVLLTGVLVSLASLGLVTALPAAIAGAGHLRRHVDGDGGGRAAVAADFRVAFRRLPAANVGLPVLAALLAWNLTAGRQAGTAAYVACLAVAALGTITVVRLAGSWTPADPPGSATAIRTALRHTASDPAGSLLLAGAVLGAVAIGWMLPPLVAVTPGLLLLASLAIHRRRSRHPSRQDHLTGN
ncbi:hypothetical protein [Actinoplanes sp. GCM10030250]|uniref:hypothetical protein n=1 Tax=Actinoplanes sp. GCM10030250 TaxID=3273376 RepID=UPI00360C7278